MLLRDDGARHELSCAGGCECQYVAWRLEVRHYQPFLCGPESLVAETCCVTPALRLPMIVVECVWCCAWPSACRKRNATSRSAATSCLVTPHASR